MIAPCSCGDPHPHEIGRRRTADGKTVVLWSDGAVTAALGFGLPGIGVPRGAYERGKAVEAGWLVLDEACVYDLSEIPALVKAARRAVRQTILAPLEFMRRTAAGERFTLVKGRIVIAHRTETK